MPQGIFPCPLSTKAWVRVHFYQESSENFRNTFVSCYWGVQETAGIEKEERKRRKRERNKMPATAVLGLAGDF